MAKVVEKDIFTHLTHKVDQWLDGQAWELEPGEDYTSLSSVRTAVYNKARYRGIKVHVRTIDGKVYVQAEV